MMTLPAAPQQPPLSNGPVGGLNFPTRVTVPLSSPKGFCRGKNLTHALIILYLQNNSRTTNTEQAHYVPQAPAQIRDTTHIENVRGSVFSLCSLLLLGVSEHRTIPTKEQQSR